MPRPEAHVVAARAVFDASADEYVRFVGTEIREEIESPIDRSLLAAFVELVGAEPGTLVADVGCGPGRVAGLLARGGITAVGFDPSAAMVAHARAAHPAIEFDLGQLDDLPLASGSLAGAVCWYSIIYTPPTLLDPGFTELARVVRPGGHLLLGFQAGSGEGFHRPDAFGTELPLTSYRHDPDAVSRRLEAAGFEVRSTTVRGAEPDRAHEVTPQAFVLARRRSRTLRR